MSEWDQYDALHQRVTDEVGSQLMIDSKGEALADVGSAMQGAVGGKTHRPAARTMSYVYIHIFMYIHLHIFMQTGGGETGCDDGDWGAFDADFEGTADEFESVCPDQFAGGLPADRAGVAGDAGGFGYGAFGGMAEGGVGFGGQVEEMTTAVAEVTENLIQELVDMGFTRDCAEVALMKSGMDLEGAASW